ncbi:MAG: hypothetical protein NVSMB27_26480 [Ktedonobacteraceae bacterium]
MLNLSDLLWQLALERLLLGRIGLVVTRAGDLEREAELFEEVPPALWMHLATELFTHPASNFGTSPHAAIRRRVLKQMVQPILLVNREQARRAPVVVTLIREGFWPTLVVAPSQKPNPVSTVAGDLGDFADAFAASQQPDDLSVAAFNRITCLAILLLQLIRTEMSSKVNILRHGFPSG